MLFEVELFDLEEVAMTQENILHQIIPALADEFEAGNRRFRTFQPSNAEEFEPLRECLAILIAEGSLIDFQKTRSYQLTPAGYLKYKDTIRALRAMTR
jgi:hypothetical protein